MGEVGGARARPRDLRVAGIEQGVDLAREGLDLVGKAGAEAAARARADGGQLRAHGGQRAQADSDLHPAADVSSAPSSSVAA